jgi:photosystem II stability/assembly factor-like uncharacterized protein
VGVNNGGVWKTDDYGRTWTPIFDAMPTGSIGDLAVSPSHPDVIYVGTGEGLHRPDLSVGDGVFRSTDGGATWTHAGLADVQQIGRLVVHPTNPNTVFVAALGHPYGPNEQRGVFRTRDGGRTWERVLYRDSRTGAAQVEFAPQNPDVLYAALWDHREGPWENAAFAGPGSGLYKSEDGGTTWRRLTTGLPGAAQGLGRVGVGIAPSEPRRLYATVDAREGGGLYRSDDAGETWTRLSSDVRLWGRGGDFAEVKVHPHNPDVVFVGNIAAYRSDDGGRTWTSFKGAPGGDDYHRLWINPAQPDIMLFATDQGATITVNGGRTWSSWYNQPTSQLYHVSTDNAFPYRVYGGQQESGAIGILSRGDGGQITFRDWSGVGSDEYAYVAPDPRDPDIVYGGRVMRWNRRTGQAQHVAPEALRSGRYRILRTMPLLFHPADPSALLFATNVLWKTTNGGQHWTIISPDLSRERPEVPASIADVAPADQQNMPRRGVIYSVAGSPLDARVIWAGTDDGLVHVTRDGGATWTDVTPPGLAAWDKVSQIDAGHFDAQTAYVSVNALRKDDLRSHVYRTHDGGRTWTRIVEGLSDVVNAVREDPKQPGLLFAGTERSVFFSVDDGAQWHPLRLNLPPSSVRDLVIHEDDLVVGTHGRSIWILDNVGPLRELAQAAVARAHLFTPPRATRVRWNMFSDTPLPPEEPAGQNPPDGAILDYHLGSAAREVVLEILGPEGDVIRRFSSADAPETVDLSAVPYPAYWIRPPQRPGTGAGHHRFVWDLRYAPPPGARRELAIAAVRGQTPTGPHGPFVHPGRYTVRLIVDGAVQERPLDVRLDPRVTISEDDLHRHTALSLRAYRAHERLQTLRDALDARLADAALPAERRDALRALRGTGAPGNPDVQYGSITAVPAETETIVGLQGKLLFMLTLLQGADARPTTQAEAAIVALEATMEALLRRGEALR